MYSIYDGLCSMDDNKLRKITCEFVPDYKINNLQYFICLYRPCRSGYNAWIKMLHLNTHWGLFRWPTGDQQAKKRSPKLHNDVLENSSFSAHRHTLLQKHYWDHAVARPQQLCCEYSWLGGCCTCTQCMELKRNQNDGNLAIKGNY